MKTEKESKVDLLFAAVISLIEEGMDIHTMKVIDITNRAGIGKGTAYEYFKSKEELVAAAIVWDIRGQFERLRERLAGAASFAEQMAHIFDWMEENMQRRRSGQQFFKMTSSSYEVTQGICQEVQKMAGENLHMYQSLLEGVRLQGQKEGKIRPELTSELADLAIVSACTSYFLYWKKKQEAKGEGASREEVRRFLYESLVKSIQ